MDLGSPDRERFRTLAVLHENRFRSVFLLEEVDTGTQVAGHRISLPTGIDADTTDARLTQTAVLFRTLDHALIPPLRETLRVESQFWCLFDYVEGPPLTQYQDCLPALSGPWIARWLGQILQILQCLHVCGIVVGGLTPNDLVVANHSVHLVDLGYLEHLCPEPVAMARTPFRRSFLAPEERNSLKHSVAGDLYSAGAVAYWLLSGDGPGSPDQSAARRRTPVPQRNVEGRMKSLLALRPDFPPEAAEVVARLLQFHGLDRGGSAADALEPLARWLSEAPSEPPPPPTRPFVPRWVDAAASDEPPGVPSAPSPDVTPIEPQVDGHTWREVPPQATLQTVVEDLSLDARRAPHLFVVLLAGLIAVGVWGVRSLRGAVSDLPTRHTPGVHVKSGHILYGVGNRWQRAHDLAVPGTLVAGPDKGGSELSLDGGSGSLSLAPRSVLHLLDLTEDLIRVEILEGEVTLTTGDNLRVAVSLPGGHITCRPRTEVDIGITGHTSTVHVREGYASLTGGSVKDAGEEAGRTIELSEGIEPRVH